MTMEVRPIPGIYQIGSWLKDHNLRGGHRLVNLAAKIGQLNRVVRFDLPGTNGFLVHLGDKDNQWSHGEFLAYEKDLIHELLLAAKGYKNQTCFIDCGADIGTVSMLAYSAMASAAPIAKIIAFEPNPDSFGLLEENLGSLSIPTLPLNQAVGDFCGQATIVYPEHDQTTHAAYVQPDLNGSVRSSTIDSLSLDPSFDLLLKIDVEGAESKVIRGAKHTLEAAANFTIAFEAHPEVMTRTGLCVADIVGQIRQIRNVSIKIAEHPDLSIDLTRPFFPQVGNPKNEVNVVCRSL